MKARTLQRLITIILVFSWGVSVGYLVSRPALAKHSKTVARVPIGDFSWMFAPPTEHYTWR